MYVCRATFVSQVLACTSLYVLRIIIIIIIIITRKKTFGFWWALPDSGFGERGKNCKGGEKSKHIAFMVSTSGTKEKPIVI